MEIVVIALLHVIVYLWKPPQKAWQFNFARKINEVLNEANFVQQDDSSRQSRNMKFYIAFRFWERLSMPTNNLIALAALASYSGHQVVVPFVYDSQQKRRGLGPRNDVLTTCKAVTQRGGQRIITVFFPQ